MSEFVCRKKLFQRGVNDFTLETKVYNRKTRKVVSQHLEDVLVYKKSTVKGKDLYSYVCFLSSTQKIGDIET